jgi:hemerythrin-like metal-binding protein
MATIPWTKAYSVGVPAIDKDHRNLFELIDTLNRALDKKLSKEKIAKAITGLIQYTEGHFAREERVMARYGYPGIGKHRVQHRNLELLVHAIYNVFIEDPDSIDPQKLMKFLNHWLVDHIIRVDMDYAKYIEKSHFTDGVSDAPLKDVKVIFDDQRTKLELEVPKRYERILQRCALLLCRDEKEAQAIRKIADPAAFMPIDEAKKLAENVLR